MSVTREALLSLIDGSLFANAILPWGKPGPIKLPDDPDARARLADAHIEGGPADVTYSPDGREPETVHVDALSLAAYTPDAAGLCHSIAIDLDAADGHGPNGLADPIAAMRCVASAADRAGLFGGVLAARSRGGRGRHVWLMLPSLVTLDDAVLGVAALTALAYRLAYADVRDYNAPNAFRRPNGSVTRPGDAGAVEMFPCSTKRPTVGWPLTLPAAGAFRESSGGVIVDGFGDQPYMLESVPRCNAAQWARFISEARTARKPKSKPIPRRLQTGNGDPLTSATTTARDFVAGRISEGQRNKAAYAAARSLLDKGMCEHEVERLILEGAAACGLPEREAKAAFQSARKRVSA